MRDLARGLVCLAFLAAVTLFGLAVGLALAAARWTADRATRLKRRKVAHG